MPPQRYERIPGTEADDTAVSHQHNPIPNSPPPSFRSRASSPAHATSRRPGTISDVGPTLEDTFNVRSDDEDDEDEGDDRMADDRRRLMHSGGNTSSSGAEFARGPTATSQQPAIAQASSRRPGNTSSFVPSNDGVFANLSAKPEFGEKLEDQPPTYEQAAADATPPYWETTILAPGMASDEVFIDGLPVGSVFSFAWNAIISMAFQLVGFLLTYLLHTTHAAKNGSRAGLGITLISWGFHMRTVLDKDEGSSGGYGNPSQPNNHDFDPSQIGDGAARMVRRATSGIVSRAATSAVSGVSSLVRRLAGGNVSNNPEDYDNSVMASWLAYLIMIIGWIILLKAVMDFIKARRHEQLILQSPDRGLSVPIVAEGEPLESVV